MARSRFDVDVEAAGEVASRVGPLDESSMLAALERHGGLTKPPGSLGRLEGLGVWLAGVQGSCPPRVLDRRRVVVFAGDHGVTARGVSAYPADVTAQMVRNVLKGGAAVSVLAELHRVEVVVLDLAVDDPLTRVAKSVKAGKVRRGSGSIDVEPAMTTAEAARAFMVGVQAAETAVDEGVDVLIPGDLGIGSTTIAAALTCAIAGAEPHEVVGRGTGIGDAAWSRKVAVVRDALRRAKPRGLEPFELLAELGGADVAAMAGMLVAAAARRTPVVLDGVVSGAAALVAARVSPGAVGYWAAGHRSTEPAHHAALTYLGLQPLVELGMRLGEGTGALVALPTLDAAVAVLRDMATFSSAGVSGATGQ